jgi:SiaC family regulatory phosphoprotein
MFRSIIMIYPEKINIEQTKKTPCILFEQGRIIFLGRSIPENPGIFYRPLKDWSSAYSGDFTGKTTVEFGFEYINTSSIKWIYAILKELSRLKDINNSASVIWYYEAGDDDMSELGFILRSLVECPFVVVEVAIMNTAWNEKVLEGTS